MTTVAWDGTSMAADRQGDLNGRRTLRVKIHRMANGGLFGSAGDAAVGVAMSEWLDGGMVPDQRPEKQSDEQDGCHCLEVRPDGTVWLHMKTGHLQRLEPFFAIGSGSDYATAAMALGQTAAEAVELACRFDVHSGGGVDVLRLPPPPEPPA